MPYTVQVPQLERHWELLDATYEPVHQTVDLRYFSSQAGWGFEFKQALSKHLVFESEHRDRVQPVMVSGVQGQVDRRPDGVVTMLFWQRDGYSFRMIGPGHAEAQLLEIGAGLKPASYLP